MELFMNKLPSVDGQRAETWESDIDRMFGCQYLMKEINVNFGNLTHTVKNRIETRTR